MTYSIDNLRSELAVLLERLREPSGHFFNGFYAGMDGVKDPVSRYEAGTSEYDDFFDGHAAGLMTKKFLEGK